jgi:integrase
MALVPTDRDVWTWDDEVSGFGLRLTPGGARTFLVQYKTPAGRTRRLALGRHGRITVEQARRLAQARLGEVAKGGDPSAERHAARVVTEGPVTVADLANAWLIHQRARAAKGKLRPRTLTEYERQLKADVLPRLGRVKLDQLGMVDAQRLHDELADRPTLANRTLDLLSAIWRWGESSRYTSGPNPCRSVERNAERRRDRHLSHDELAALGEALRAMAGTRAMPVRVAALIRLIALTGCRPGEIKSLAWADADLGRHVLHLRDAKTGDRDVWLAEPALAVLRDLPRVKDSPWVFPSPRQKDRAVREFRKPWATALAAARIADAMPYVLRHTLASESESLGHSPYLTAALLGHAMGGRDMTRGYVHHVANEVRAASERVARRIAAAMDGEVASDNVVVPLRA